MTPLVSMRLALDEPALFGKALAGESWAAWRILLIGAMGEKLKDDERAIFTALTGREREPLSRVDELWSIVGRRGGKTRAAAVLAAYLAALCDHADKLAPGERGVLPIMSASTWQAQKAFGFLSGIFAEIPALAALVENETADTLSLTTRIDVECRPASFRTARGSTFIGAVCDELAYWRSDETSRNPDTAILGAIRPALATTGGPLIVISSPYAQSGELWGAFKRDYGPNGDPLVLVCKAASRTMNPTLSQKVVDRAYERDPQAAAAEFGGDFRSDVFGFLSADLVDIAVDRGVLVRPPVPGVRYRSGADPSGGSKDSFCLAICHDEGNVVILDCLVEVRAPFNPTEATARMAAVLNQYGLKRTVGDRYAASWVVDAFAKVGISYQHSDRDRSACYLDTLPLFTAGRVRLLDNPRLVTQFVGLERRTSPSGRDRVDHGVSGSDDTANAAAIALSSKGAAPLTITHPDLNSRGDVFARIGGRTERESFDIGRRF